MIKFAERLRTLRTENGKTQREMAELLEMNLRAYQYYEGDERRPDFEKLVQLADYFSVTTDYLLGRSDRRT